MVLPEYKSAPTEELEDCSYECYLMIAPIPHCEINEFGNERTSTKVKNACKITNLPCKNSKLLVQVIMIPIYFVLQIDLSQ